MQIAVVGNDEFVTGFRLAGVNHVYAVEHHMEDLIDQVIQLREIGILVLEESAFNQLHHKTKKRLEKLIRPVLVTISDKGQPTNLREMIKRSLGVDLWK